MKTHIFTTTTGAMKNAFGGLLNEHRHWTHPVIHETLVDLLMIQKKIHRGIFAVMDGTFAGDGPGPRCMVPHVKNVLLASSDQVAIDAVAAKLMGMDPMRDLKFVRLAHDLGLGWGDVRDIEIVGDVDAANENWNFDGPFKKMTFASRNQHRIYWGPLKKPIEWSLKTWLAPWAYVASVTYHDMFWSALREGEDGPRAGERVGTPCSRTGARCRPTRRGGLPGGRRGEPRARPGAGEALPRGHAPHGDGGRGVPGDHGPQAGARAQAAGGGGAAAVVPERAAPRPGREVERSRSRPSAGGGRGGGWMARGWVAPGTPPWPRLSVPRWSRATAVAPTSRPARRPRRT